MYVKVEEAVLKESPSFWGKNGASVFYGEEVVILEEKNSWKKVQLVIDSSVSGWISESSLTQKKIVASGNRVSASTEELALAGKGFTAEIEAEYKKQVKQEKATKKAKATKDSTNSNETKKEEVEIIEPDNNDK